MFNDFYHTFYYLLLIFGSVVSLILVLKVNIPFKTLCLLIIITVISELIAKYISFGLRMNNNIVYHFFVVFEYGLYCLIFHYLLKSEILSKILVYSFVCLTMGEVINTVYFQPILQSNTNILILEALLLVIWSLVLFKKLREEIDFGNILEQPVFWFNSIVLVYYTFNILIWGFHSLKIYRLERPPMIIYNINLLLSGVLYFVFSYAIILQYLKKSPKIKA
jgi:hypothetical protein